MKRFCQTLTLPNDRDLINKYLEVHNNVWPEVIQGQREVGILSMQIYAFGNLLFMIIDTIDTFDWDIDMKRLSLMPDQIRWEAYVSKFQGCNPSASSIEKWKLMSKIFDSQGLYLHK